MRAARRFDDTGDAAALHQQRLRSAEGGELIGVDDTFAGDVGLPCGLAEQVVEVRVRAQVLGVAPAVRPVEVDQGRVEGERRHSDQLLPVPVGGGDGPQAGVDPHHVRAQPGPYGQERQPVRGGRQPPHEHRLVQLRQLQLATLAGRPEVRFEGDRVEGGEGRDELAYPPGRRQQPDVGAAVGDHGQVGQAGAQESPYERHRLAARAPAADAYRHAALQPGHGLVGGHRLVGAHGRSFATNASRRRSATPLRFASNVKPCS